ncbi:hypothetical protein AgCh_037089 [Apium graveolens]
MHRSGYIVALHEDTMKFWLAIVAEEPAGEWRARRRKKEMRKYDFVMSAAVKNERWSLATISFWAPYSVPVPVPVPVQ